MAARPHVHREVEHTYAPQADARLPDLTGLPGVVSVADPEVHELEATYHDTAELALTRAGLTLRARSGGPDEGWHLKLPAPGGRDELHHRLGRGRTVPARLRDLVVPWTLGATLVPVAVVATRRTSYRLLGEDGTVLAELADDEVTGTPTGGAPVRWREWELELVEGGPDLLAAADELLAEAGAELRPLARKIAVTLGDRLPPAGAPEDPVHAWLAAQVAELRLRECQARRGDADGVRRTRIAARRLRAALAVLRPALDQERTEPLRDELRHLSRALAAARDADAIRTRLLDLLEDEREGVAAARRLVRSTYDERERVALGEVGEELAGDRHLALLAALDALATDPAFTKPVTAKLLRKRLAKQERRVAERVADAETEVHEVRKAAKRWRYAAEVAEPVLGKEAKKARKRAKRMTRELGVHQDASMVRDELRALAAGADTGTAFLLGRLHAREEARAAEIEERRGVTW
ncbi:CHAD domain-containing protein [Nocardioides sp. SYSU DS0663]|uniref:CYTH and CHAD domain-containing protein n=1 Tax=Nocardioides sp. SYSU DS0663 TaxID=3416445 RepID=UPI003F4BA0C1